MAFASLLMFLELGFRNGLFDSQAYVARMMNADLVIVNSQKEAVVPKLPFSRRRLLQAKGVPGIVAAYPLYIDEYHSGWKNSQNGRDYPLLVYGMNPDDPAFLIPDVQRLAASLKQPDTASSTRSRETSTAGSKRIRRRNCDTAGCAWSGHSSSGLTSAPTATSLSATARSSTHSAIRPTARARRRASNSGC